MVSLLFGFLRQRLKALTFFGKTPIKKLDQVEAQGMHHSAHNPHGEVDGMANEQDQHAQQHTYAFGLERGHSQVVEDLRQFDRSQPQGEQSQVAQDIPKRLGKLQQSFQSIHQTAQELFWHQTERALAVKEQHQQTTEHQASPPERAQRRQRRIAFPHPNAEAAQDDGGPPQAAE